MRFSRTARASTGLALLADRYPGEVAGVGHHVLDQLEGVEQHVADQVRNRDPELRGPGAELLVEILGNPRMQDLFLLLRRVILTVV